MYNDVLMISLTGRCPFGYEVTGVELGYHTCKATNDTFSFEWTCGYGRVDVDVLYDAM